VLRRSPAAAVPALRSSKYLRNSELGAVSVSNDGTEVAVSMGRSLTLDSSHQVRRQGLLAHERFPGRWPSCLIGGES
jgi:hypothetical protein